MPDRDWPTEWLCAFVEGDANEADVEAVDALTGALGAARGDWFLGPPDFVDDVDEAGLRIVGVGLCIYARTSGAVAGSLGGVSPVPRMRRSAQVGGDRVTFVAAARVFGNDAGGRLESVEWSGSTRP
jgi:hypothetical protein